MVCVCGPSVICVHVLISASICIICINTCKLKHTIYSVGLQRGDVCQPHSSF